MHLILPKYPFCSTRLDKATLLFLFLFSPMLSLFSLFRECYNNKKYAYILISIFFGLCAMLVLPPKGDSYRHALNFFKIQNYTWYDFQMFLSSQIKFDFLLWLLEFVYAKIGFTFSFVKFTLVFIGYILYLNIYDSLCIHIYKTPKQRCYCFWIILLIIPCMSIAYGLRYGFAASLVAFVVSRWYVLRKYDWWNFVLLIVALFFHFGILMILLLLVAVKFAPNSMTKWMFCLLMGFSMLVSESLNLIVQYIPFSQDLHDYLLTYTEGEWKDASALSGFNMFFWFPIIAKQYVLQLIILYYTLRYLPYNRNTKFLFWLFILWTFSSSFFAINQRVGVLIPYVGGVFLLYYIGIRSMLLKSLLITTIFINVMDWRVYTVNHWYYLFAPVPVSIVTDYDEDWVDKNVTVEGSLYVNIR